jgi:hypothetical protein
MAAQGQRAHERQRGVDVTGAFDAIENRAHETRMTSTAAPFFGAKADPV